MMDRRSWTLIILPPKNGKSREVSLPGWTFRALAWGALITTLLVGGAVTVLFTPWGTPGSRLVASQNASLQQEIEEIEDRFRVLEDTLLMLAKREEQLRMLAGLPVEATPVRDTASSRGSVATASLVD